MCIKVMPRIKVYSTLPTRKKRSPKTSELKFSVVSILMVALVIVSAVALLLSYLSCYVNPAVFAVPMFFGLYFIPIFIVNVVLFLVSLLRVKRYCFISLIALLPTIFYSELFYRPSKERPLYEGEPIKLMTYNVGRFSAADKGVPKEQTFNSIISFVQNENPDIVALQEFRIADTLAIRSVLKGMPYRYYHLFKGKEYFGNIIFSKYPIKNAGRIRFEKSTNLCIWADIEINGNIKRIYNCHLESSSISFTALIKRLSKRGEFSNEVKSVHEKLLGTNIRRSRQVNLMLTDISGCQHPTIVCGDFNDPPMSYTYRKLREGRKDSFVEAGEGWSATYSFLWPMLRIDYILVPEETNVDHNVIQRVRYSDHYPVSTLIYL
jgi:endonuclease/exonuclease/phosphatase family metal-dependent hydrolase